uniref:Uncharacterized LOC100185653 n=1 Tax=Ciona intestinalis TaxID=7719 RepID=F6U516_CIOIN|nr:uncharacterized protein LOC100185653 [Ciona intestinalis]|eukprot:XP_002128562.1 uncharacterized protein LOC100185653 [Ciona intestinalis]
MTSHVKQEALRLAIKGMFIGDSVAMPVHWYYNVLDIKRDFNGWISKYERPLSDHPSSILRKSNKGGSGRHASDKDHPPPVIGNVILHGKLDAWSENASTSHYHQGMAAGQNTLNCHCALQVMRTLSSRGFDSDTDLIKQVLHDYVVFMTTPNSHNDTYAESWHRAFFADWVVANKPTDRDVLFEFAKRRSDRMLKQSPDKQLEAVGLFVVPLPIILYNIHRPLDHVVKIAKEFVRITHPVNLIDEHLVRYITVLHSVVRGASLRDEAEKALKECLGPTAVHMINAFDAKIEKSTDVLSTFQRVTDQIGIACYIEGAMTNIYHICRHYYDDFESGILMNVNIGGENCHRGSALGALLGASAGALGKSIPKKWTEALDFNDKIDQLFNQNLKK